MNNNNLVETIRSTLNSVSFFDLLDFLHTIKTAKKYKVNLGELCLIVEDEIERKISNYEED